MPADDRYASRHGALAEWLRSGLQSRLHRFDSGRRLRGHAIVRPPLTESVWPVMYPARSEARKATAAAMSSGSARRRIGTARTSASTSFWPPSAAIPSSMGVRVGPGQTAFAVMPARAVSRAIVFVNAITAPFAPAYTLSIDEPTRAASEAMLTIRP